MRRFGSETQVPGGYYLNTTSWAIHPVEGEHGLLPGARGTQWVRLAMPLMAVAAATLSLGFVIFLPAIGLGLFAWVVARALLLGLRTVAERLARTFAPQWRPGEAYLARREAPPKAGPAPQALEAILQEVEARRAEEPPAKHE